MAEEPVRVRIVFESARRREDVRGSFHERSDEKYEW